MGEVSNDPTEPMALVGEPHRVDILYAFVDQRRSEPYDPGLSFSELHDRTDIEDKGKFNYHLDQLRGHYVEQTDEGYRLTMPGDRIVAAMLAGDYSDGQRVVTTDQPCRECDADIVVEFDAGMTYVHCSADAAHGGFCTCLPPGTADDHSGAQLVRLASLHWRTIAEFSVRGLCMECFGAANGELVEVERAGDAIYRYESICTRCGFRFGINLGAIAVRHPAVVSLYYDHGRDVREVPPWELNVVWPDNHEVRGRDPHRIAVTAREQGDAVTLVIDASGTIVDVEDRESATPSQHTSQKT